MGQMHLRGGVSETPPLEGQLAGFAENYRFALSEHLAGRDKTGVRTARELGCKALAARLGIANLTQIHSEAMGALLFSSAAEADRTRIGAAQEFLHQAISPFDRSQGELVERNQKLIDLNATLIARNQ